MIQLTEIRYTKNPNTKTTYNKESERVKEISLEQYENITSKDTLKWFRRLGGSETAVKSYTKKGYNVVRLTSKSPDKQIKVVRTFKFI